MGLFVIAGTFRCGKRGAERRARGFSVVAGERSGLADGCLTKLHILPLSFGGQGPSGQR
jgi:hypothetical protein